jgi:tetratricopeptide (TPR) repeat protein
MRYVALVLIFLLFPPALQAQQDDLLTRTRILLFNGKFREVLLVTDSLEIPESLKGELFYYRGYAFAQLSRHDIAIYNFLQALKEDSTNLSYKTELGKAYQSSGRTREAVALFEEVMREDTADQKTKLDLAALSHFERAFVLNPADAYLTQQIANIYLGEGQLDKALYTVRKGIDQDTAYTDLMSLRGYIWFLKENPASAIKDFQASASRDSNSVFTYKYLGLAFLQEKRFDEARMSLLRAYQMDSLDITIIFSQSDAGWI